MNPPSYIDKEPTKTPPYSKYSQDALKLNATYISDKLENDRVQKIYDKYYAKILLKIKKAYDDVQSISDKGKYKSIIYKTNHINDSSNDMAINIDIENVIRKISTSLNESKQYSVKINTIHKTIYESYCCGVTSYKYHSIYFYWG